MVGCASCGSENPEGELAGWVGSSREGVNKALQQLQRQGYVAAERRQITALDVEGLRGRAS
jgi:DNA-binding GntR family transcriptional regulator